MEKRWKKNTIKRKTPHTSSMPSCALWTLHPALLWLWWKVGCNPFQFGQCATVLLKPIDWLNRGTISQYAGADKPSRGETWHLRRGKGTLASISLALRLTFNHGGGRHTRTHACWGQAAVGRESKKTRGEREKNSGEKWGPSLPSFFFKFSLQV